MTEMQQGGMFILSSPVYEYKVLGHEPVQVDGTSHKLSDVLSTVGLHPRYAESALNALAAEGWEPVSLDFPFVFRRVKA